MDQRFYMVGAQSASGLGFTSPSDESLLRLNVAIIIKGTRCTQNDRGHAPDSSIRRVPL